MSCGLCGSRRRIVPRVSLYVILSLCWGRVLTRLRLVVGLLLFLSLVGCDPTKLHWAVVLCFFPVRVLCYCRHRVVVLVACIACTRCTVLLVWRIAVLLLLSLLCSSGGAMLPASRVRMLRVRDASRFLGRAISIAPLGGRSGISWRRCPLLGFLLLVVLAVYQIWRNDALPILCNLGPKPDRIRM